MRTLVCSIAFALLLTTAHRLPAPIQEETTPAPTVASSSEPRKPLPKPKSKPNGAARFAGTWIGRIKAGSAGEVDVTLLINADGTLVAQSSKAGIWNRALFYDGQRLSWKTGTNNQIAWTLTPNPDQQSALVIRSWSRGQDSGIFKRTRSTEAAANTMPVTEASKETRPSGDASLPKGAVHLVINSDSDARKIFTYFRLPPVEAPQEELKDEVVGGVPLAAEGIGGTPESVTAISKALRRGRPTGVYRLEVSPDGTVAAVTILKSMGSTRDAASVKAFVKWRAKPGPLRIVDFGVR